MWSTRSIPGRAIAANIIRSNGNPGPVPLLIPHLSHNGVDYFTGGFA